MAQEKPVAVEEKLLVAEEEPTLWETVKGVFFVLGLAAALTLSFGVLNAYEMGFTQASYPQSSLANSAAEEQRQKQKVAVENKDYLMSAARPGASHILAA